MTVSRSGVEGELVEQAGVWADVAVGSIVQSLVPTLCRRCPEAAGSVALVLADDRLVHDLNSRYRGADRPTNVLSFPSGEEIGPGRELGDVVVAEETLRREARADGKPLDNHFAHLALHGMLHLLGYDHEDDASATVMESLETEILAELGIPDPYADDSAALTD